MASNDQPAQQRPVKITDLTQVMQSFQQVWNGLTSWFSPGKPVEPVQPEAEPRQRQMPVGSNIQYVPRGTESTSFEQLRFFYTNYDVAGICVQTRIEQLQGIEWSVVAKGDSKGDAAKTNSAAGDKYKDEINAATEFFNKPDKKHDWPTWLRMVLEQRLVLDAVTLWPRPTRGGQLYGLDVIDGACYSEDTEVLTKRGWLRFDQVKIGPNGDQFATRNQANKDFEWQHATYFHEAEWDAPLINFHSRTLDLLVSPNHRMLVTSLPRSLGGHSRLRQPGEVIVKAECLAAHKSGRQAIPSLSEWTAADTEIITFNPESMREYGMQFTGDDFAAFMGMWLSKGSLGTRGTVNISQKPESKGFTEYRDLIHRIFGRHVCHTGSNFVFRNMALSRYLSEFGHAKDKYIPEEVKGLSRRQLRVFLHYYVLGDGCIDGKRRRIYTGSKRMADDLQEIAQKAGYSAGVRTRMARAGSALPGGRTLKQDSIGYVVSLRTTAEQHFSVRRVGYVGKIYCVSVPNEILYVRRNGQPAWCGNTIKPLVDWRGAIPDPPAPALQQILYGMPRGVYTDGGPLLGDPGVEQAQRILPLLYLPQNVRAHTPYGYPEIEKVLMIVNTALRKRMADLSHFTEGNIPRALVAVPAEWTPEQIKKYQEYWDAMLAGDLARNARLWFTAAAGRGAGGVPVKEFIEFNGTPEFDLWLLKLTCAALRMTPSEIGFTDDVNRATAETQGDVQNRSSIRPLCRYVKSIADRVLGEYLSMPFLEFQFQMEESENALEKAQATKLYVDMGALQVDEVRGDLGRKPYGTPPFILTPNGPILIDHIAEMGQAKLDGAKTEALGNFGAPTGAPKPRATGMADNKSQDDGDATYGTDKCCAGSVHGTNVLMEKSGSGGDYDGVDIDWHQTFCDAPKSPDLGEPYPGAVTAIQTLLDAGYTVYLSCGGLSDPDAGPELKQRMRNHLLQHGIDPDQGIVFRAKPRTIAVVDDRAIQFNGDWNQTLQTILSRGTTEKSLAAGAVVASLFTPVTSGRATKIQAGYVDQKGIGGCLNCMWFDPIKQGCKVVGDTPSTACCNYWNSDPAPEGLSREQAGWVNVPGAAYLCSDCVFFNADQRTCERVYGEIEPNGSCNLWEMGLSQAVIRVEPLPPIIDVMGNPGATTGSLSTDGEPTRKAAYQLARDDLRRWRTVVTKCVKSNMAIRPFNSEHIPDPVKNAVLSELDNLTKFGAPNRPQFVAEVFKKALTVLENAETLNKE